jgi:hypothetical protein
MSTIELFTALVLLAFVGGIRAARGANNPWSRLSGVEYVLLGLTLGPHLLGLVSKGGVRDFEPLLFMALGWLVAVRGAKFATHPSGPLTRLEIAISVVSSAATCVIVYGVARTLALRWGIPHAHTIALGLSVVSADSCSVLGESVVPREQLSPYVRSLHGLTSATELAPVLALSAILLVGDRSSDLIAGYPGIALAVALGVVLGGIVAAVIGAHFDQGELWPLLVGALLLVVGSALRLNLPGLTPAFLLGLAVVGLSQHRTEIRALMVTTDRQLLVPCLVLAGVVLDFPARPVEWLCVALAVALRLGVKFLLAGVAAVTTGAGARGAFLGAGATLRTNSLSIMIGLSVFLRHSDGLASDMLGRIVLGAAIANTVVGELLGPRAVRALLGGQSGPMEVRV